jgi:hypothetical protein
MHTLFVIGLPGNKEKCIFVAWQRMVDHGVEGNNYLCGNQLISIPLAAYVFVPSVFGENIQTAEFGK